MINSYQELKNEIQVLKAKRAEQELFFFQKKEKLKRAFSSPLKFLSEIKSFFSGGNHVNPSGKPKKSDWATALGRVFFPFLLNKTILRGNNFLIKSLISVISQRTINADSFNREKVAHWIDGVSNWINKTLKKSGRKKQVDYGIPPDSESY